MNPEPDQRRPPGPEPVMAGLHGRCVVIRLHGDLGDIEARVLRETLRKALPLADPPLVVVDLGGVARASAEVTDDLMEAAAMVRAAGGTLVFAGDRSRINTRFGDAALLDGQPFHGEIEEALAQLSPES